MTTRVSAPLEVILHELDQLIDHNCEPDGNCLFRALFMLLYGIEDRWDEVKTQILSYAETRPDWLIQFFDITISADSDADDRTFVKFFGISAPPMHEVASTASQAPGTLLRRYFEFSKELEKITSSCPAASTWISADANDVNQLQRKKIVAKFAWTDESKQCFIGLKAEVSVTVPRNGEVWLEVLRRFRSFHPECALADNSIRIPFMTSKKALNFLQATIRFSYGNLIHITFAKCATTGIAAHLIGGRTVHSFLGMDFEFNSRIQHGTFQAKALSNTQVVFVDEVSMMSREALTMLDETLRKFNNQNNGTPFAGKSIILLGDPAQLQAVGKHIWREDQFKMFQVVVLREVKRQSDTPFIELLNRMRLGNLTDADMQMEFLALMEKRGIIPAACLSMRPGTKLMLLRNLPNGQANFGCVNGAMCIVEELTDDCIIVHMQSHPLPFKRLQHDLPNSRGPKSQRWQFPFDLAYGCTVHKAQGQSLTPCVYDGERQAFSGGGYAACSRATGFQQLYFLSVGQKEQYILLPQLKQLLVWMDFHDIGKGWDEKRGRAVMPLVPYPKPGFQRIGLQTARPNCAVPYDRVTKDDNDVKRFLKLRVVNILEAVMLCEIIFLPIDIVPGSRVFMRKKHREAAKGDSPYYDTKLDNYFLRSELLEDVTYQEYFEQKRLCGKTTRRFFVDQSPAKRKWVRRANSERCAVGHFRYFAPHGDNVESYCLIKLLKARAARRSTVEGWIGEFGSYLSACIHLGLLEKGAEALHFLEECAMEGFGDLRLREMVERFKEQGWLEDPDIDGLLETLAPAHRAFERPEKTTIPLEEFLTNMTPSQRSAFTYTTDKWGAGQPVRLLITGGAGVGKSYLLKALVAWLRDRHITFAKCATTGIAAHLIGGRTVHSLLSMDFEFNSRIQHGTFQAKAE
ncbi:hypothetical protein BV898_19239 [Hypsibius exemplaris]|uniref:ATP-dependent DNA helicase n=1 Tax=Hypsibius exemplaris TaxID=2072580 RepID=A0A9X6RPJ5_HYPEX|nr:hypothetical protein BV898_19239 [Hypsibius exemplaris]